MIVLVPATKDKTKRHLASLSSSHVIICFLVSGLIRKGGEYVFRIDSFRSLRTWIPFLGGDMEVVDFIGQYIDIPEAERSAGMQNLINDFSSVNQLSSFCFWASIVLALIVYFLIKAKRGREIIRLSACLSHICSILVIYCGFKFYNSFSDYLWGIGGQIDYLYILFPICIAAYDIYSLSTRTLRDPGLSFLDSWLFDGIGLQNKRVTTQETNSNIKKENDDSRVVSATNKVDVSTYSHGLDRGKLWKWGIPLGVAIVVAIVLVLHFIPFNKGRQLMEGATTNEIKVLSEKDFNRQIVKADSREAAILLVSRLFSAIAAKEYGSLYGLFAKDVEHYEETIPRANAVSFWAGYSNFILSVESELDLLDYSATTAALGFVLQAKDSNNTLIGAFPFYVIVKKENGAWVIGTEGQFIQDPTEAKTQYQSTIDGTHQNVFTVVYAVSDDGFVNVRSEPSNNGRILAQLYEMFYGLGSGVLVEKGESWSKVSVDGTIGWCYNKYLGSQTWYTGTGTRTLVAKYDNTPIYGEDFSGEGNRPVFTRVGKGIIIADNFDEFNGYYVLSTANEGLYVSKNDVIVH